VRRVVTRPEEHVWLHHIAHILEHVIEYSGR
jgi:hypothetical protein